MENGQKRGSFTGSLGFVLAAAGLLAAVLMLRRVSVNN